MVRLCTQSRAANNNNEAKKYLQGTMFLLVLSSIILTIILFPTMKPILQILGANGEMLTLGVKYLRCIAIGLVFQIFATGVVPIIRNNNGATFAMITMIAGFLCNIVLDYLFVWVYEWNVEGAALATIAGQALTAIGGIIYLVYHKMPVWKIKIAGMGTIVKNIIKIGIAPFGISISTSVSHVLMNRFSVQFGGETAIASYACIGYVYSIVLLLIQGVGDGSQPLVSHYYGEKNPKATRWTRKMAYCTAEILTVFSIVALYTLRSKIGILFGASQATSENIAWILPIFLCGFIVLPISRVTSSYFYATKKTNYSYALVYAEPILQVILLIALSCFWGQTGIWWSMPLAQILTAFLAFALKSITDRKVAFK